ncbi:MAG: discoidin domain-containing protein [Chloroflexota bacterium]
MIVGGRAGRAAHPHATLVLALILGATAATAAAVPVALPAAAQEPSVPPPIPAPSTVRDFAEIAASGPTVEADPSGTAVTIHVTTTIDAACSVVFGTDPAFGRIATDMDMAGGGHRDHHPVLAGLTPGTTYRYRLQGTGPDGTLYQSAMLAFRTPDAPAADASLGADLRANATIAAVSSEYSPAFAAANAIDGDLTTEWSSAGDGDEAFITIDLGSPQVVGSVAWDSRSMTDGSAITNTFTLTADGTEVGTFPAGPDPVPVEVTAQVLRFDVASSTGGNTGAREIVIRGPAR